MPSYSAQLPDRSTSQITNFVYPSTRHILARVYSRLRHPLLSRPKTTMVGSHLMQANCFGHLEILRYGQPMLASLAKFGEPILQIGHVSLTSPSSHQRLISILLHPIASATNLSRTDLYFTVGVGSRCRNTTMAPSPVYQRPNA